MNLTTGDNDSVIIAHCSEHSTCPFNEATPFKILGKNTEI